MHFNIQRQQKIRTVRRVNFFVVQKKIEKRGRGDFAYYLCSQKAVITWKFFWGHFYLKSWQDAFFQNWQFLIKIADVIVRTSLLNYASNNFWQRLCLNLKKLGFNGILNTMKDLVGITLYSKFCFTNVTTTGKVEKE